MENVSFVLWVALWPLACTAGDYLDAKKNHLCGCEELSYEARFISSVIKIIIWVCVAKSL